MEEYNIKREYNCEEGETVYDQREYIISSENNKYLLRLEIIDKNIFFILSLNDNIEYNYKTKMDLLTLVNKLSLNANRYSNFEAILQLLDKIYEKQKMSINQSTDVFCILEIKLINAIEEEEIYEIKLNKNYMKEKDKFNILFNQIKLLKEKKEDNGNNEQLNKTVN